MILTLKIDNYDRLETGGPTAITLNGHGCQAGRAPSMDWVLPDPQRHVSCHHFEVSFDGSTYWLRDLSTNGTFLDGERHRLQAPVRLRAGLRFTVGTYIIAVHEGAGGQPVGRPAAYAPGHDDDPWDLGPGPLEPVNPIPPAPPRHLDDVAGEFVPAPPFPSAPTPGPDAPVPPVPRPQAAPQQAPRGPDSAAMVAAFCTAAGLDPKAHAAADPMALMAESGAALRVVTAELMAMLRDRARVKEFTGGGARTMRAAEGNNPLKFMPDPQQALEALFLSPREGFLTGAAGVQDAMGDLRGHQMAVFAALQPALRDVLEGLSPEEVEARVGRGLLAGGKGRWTAYVTAWDEKAASGDNGMLDAFMAAFARAYAAATQDREF